MPDNHLRPFLSNDPHRCSPAIRVHQSACRENRPYLVCPACYWSALNDTCQTVWRNIHPLEVSTRSLHAESWKKSAACSLSVSSVSVNKQQAQSHGRLFRALRCGKIKGGTCRIICFWVPYQRRFLDNVPFWKNSNHAGHVHFRHRPCLKASKRNQNAAVASSHNADRERGCKQIAVSVV